MTLTELNPRIPRLFTKLTSFLRVVLITPLDVRMILSRNLSLMFCCFSYFIVVKAISYKKLVSNRIYSVIKTLFCFLWWEAFIPLCFPEAWFLTICVRSCLVSSSEIVHLCDRSQKDVSPMIGEYVHCSFVSFNTFVRWHLH